MKAKLLNTPRLLAFFTSKEGFVENENVFYSTNFLALQKVTVLVTKNQILGYKYYESITLEKTS